MGKFDDDDETVIEVINGAPLSPDDTVQRLRALRCSSRVIQPASQYDGDAEFHELLAPKYVPWNPLSETQTLNGTECKDWRISAQLYEVSLDGKSYRLRKITSKDEFQKVVIEATERWEQMEESGKLIDIAPPHRLREASRITREQKIEAAAQHLIEDFDRGGNGLSNAGPFGTTGQSWASPTYGSQIDVNAEYIPLIGGPSSKQLYQYQYLDQHRKAFESVNHNPVAHQLVNLQTAFILGRGLDHTSTNPEVEEVWREFVERTDFYSDLETIANDFWWAGELMMEMYDDAPEKGYVDYRMIDPSTCWEVVTDVEDIQKVYYYHCQWSSPYQMYTKGNIQTMKYVIRQVPGNDVIHLKINASKWEKRGRTDLFSILGWLKRLKDLMNARVIKGQLEAAFVWDVEVNSGDADVAAVEAQLPDPYKAGSTFLHNRNLKLTAIGGNIKGNESSPDVGALINMIAVGFGIPKEFIGEAGRAARAGALTATEPGTKRFEQRQRLIEKLCHMVANRVICCAIRAKRLNLDDIVKDARSVTKLTRTDEDLPHRDNVMDDMEQKQQDAEDQAKQVADQQMKVTNKMALKDQQHQHDMEKMTVGQSHRQELARIKQGPMVPASMAQSKESQARDKWNGQYRPGKMGHELSAFTAALRDLAQGVPIDDVRAKHKISMDIPADDEPTKDAIRRVAGLAEAAIRDILEANENTRKPQKNKPLNPEQKSRIGTIKKRENYSREFLEFIFPAIAQEDRSAKLKDLALAEAMQWLPKSWAAKIAAKELNITTYAFEDAWKTIVEEAKLGMSIAHVYTQDNQHVPETTIAQDVQAELAAKQPVPPQNQMTNVPMPQAVAGDKLMPAQPKGTGGQSNPSSGPGKSPNSGSTKTNKFSGQDPTHTDPTAKSHGYSAAANHPMGSEGIGKIKKAAMKQSLPSALRFLLLRETLAPAMTSVRKLAEHIFSTNREAEEVTNGEKQED